MKETLGLRKAVSFAAASSIALGAMSAIAPVAQAAPTAQSAAVTAVASKPYTPCSYHSSHPQIKRGSTGKPVTHLQCLLQVMGYGYVAQDGIFGRQTDKAVRAFQKSHKLVIDGIVGPKTWASLHAAVDKKLG